MIARPIKLFAAAALVALRLGMSSTLATADDVLMSETSVGFVTKNCLECHSGSNPEAGFSVDPLSPPLGDNGSIRFWTQILGLLQFTCI